MMDLACKMVRRAMGGIEKREDKRHVIKEGLIGKWVNSSVMPILDLPQLSFRTTFVLSPDTNE
jgi:hypothetical protein